MLIYAAFQATSTKLVAQQKLDTPITREVVEVGVNKAALGKAFKKEAGSVTAAVHALEDDEKLRMKEQLASDTYKVEKILEFDFFTVDYSTFLDFFQNFPTDFFRLSILSGPKLLKSAY